MNTVIRFIVYKNPVKKTLKDKDIYKIKKN